MTQRPVPDLIVWPETSYPGCWSAIAPGLPLNQVSAEVLSEVRRNQRIIRQLVRAWPTNVLLGANSEVLGADLIAHDEYGWASAVVESAEERGGREACLLKVPHHGSPNADDDALWEHLLETPATACVTSRVGHSRSSIKVLIDCSISPQAPFDTPSRTRCRVRPSRPTL